MTTYMNPESLERVAFEHFYIRLIMVSSMVLDIPNVEPRKPDSENPYAVCDADGYGDVEITFLAASLAMADISTNGEIVWKTPGRNASENYGGFMIIGVTAEGTETPLWYKPFLYPITKSASSITFVL